jgi:hypothetical protein
MYWKMLTHSRVSMMRFFGFTIVLLGRLLEVYGTLMSLHQDSGKWRSDIQLFLAWVPPKTT